MTPNFWMIEMSDVKKFLYFKLVNDYQYFLLLYIIIYFLSKNKCKGIWTNINRLTPSVHQPAAAASHRVFVFQQGHQLPLQQADVIFLTGIAVTLELIELIHCKLFQEPGFLLLCLSGDLWDLKRMYESAGTLIGPYGFTLFFPFVILPFSCPVFQS